MQAGVFVAKPQWLVERHEAVEPHLPWQNVSPAAPGEQEKSHRPDVHGQTPQSALVLHVTLVLPPVLRLLQPPVAAASLKSTQVFAPDGRWKKPRLSAIVPTVVPVSAVTPV
jgi:hypothetical protein